jgi:hypothetical protein
MSNATETFARDALAAWEKAASAMSAELVRDPRTLEVGAGLMRAGLMWKGALDTMTAQWMAHVAGLTSNQTSNQPGNQAGAAR